MVDYIFCEKCNKVIDEFEKFCYWCKKQEELKNKKETQKEVDKNE